MTGTSIPRLVITLAVPSIISMMISGIYNLVDTAFVGRLGTSASGAVGVVFGFTAILQAVSFMFGQGAGSILSRALGRRDTDAASVHASAGFFGAMACGLVISIAGFLRLDYIVMLLGSTATIAPYAKTYIGYILIASPFMCGCFALNNILRYEGKASLGMIGLLSGAVLNMAGDPILMFGLDMGIAGAGLSTAASQIISWLILVRMFLSGRTESSLSIRKALHAGGAVYWNICTTGLPSLLRQGLNSLVTVLLNAQCAVFGDAAVAGMSIVSRIIFFVFSVALGIGQGFQPVSAYNYGAGRYTRLRKAFRFTAYASEAIIIVGCILLLVFSGNLIGLFRDDPDVIAVGTRALRLQAVSYLLMPVCMTTEMLYQSTGHRLGASFMSSVRSGLLFIPLLFLLSHYRGLAGIQEAQPIALLLSTPMIIPFAIRFFRRLPLEDKQNSDGQ